MSLVPYCRKMPLTAELRLDGGDGQGLKKLPVMVAGRGELLWWTGRQQMRSGTGALNVRTDKKPHGEWGNKC